MTDEDAANVGQRLAAGSAVVVCRAKAGKPELAYPMTVKGDDGDHLIVAGPFSQSETLELGYTRFEPEDWFVEHFWRSRWFAIAQVMAADGATKGWYCDITRPAEVSAGVVRSADLYLDLWVPLDGSRPLVLDEDEFEASGLARADPSAAAAAQAALAELATIVELDLSAFLASRPAPA